MNATQEEIDAAATTVVYALSHPLMRRAAAISTGILRREVPIMLRRDDGTLAEGVVDLAFLEEGPDFAGWSVVDFKTDLEFESGRTEYSAQVALYAEAIEKGRACTMKGCSLLPSFAHSKRAGGGWPRTKLRSVRRSCGLEPHTSSRCCLSSDALAARFRRSQHWRMDA